MGNIDDLGDLTDISTDTYRAIVFDVFGDDLVVRDSQEIGVTIEPPNGTYEISLILRGSGQGEVQVSAFARIQGKFVDEQKVAESMKRGIELNGDAIDAAIRDVLDEVGGKAFGLLKREVSARDEDLDAIS